MWKAIICFPFILAIILQEASSCPDLPPKCSNPAKDGNEVIRCHFTSVFQENALDKVISETGVMFCKGKSNDEMAKEFKTIVTKNAVGVSAIKLMGPLAQYTSCLNKKKTSLEKEVSALAKELLEKFKKEYNSLKSSVEPLKKNCNPAEVKKALFAVLCPLLTKDNAKKVAAAAKKAQSSDGFQCAVDNLDPAVISIKKFL